jgi:iron(III) transport system permease protein
VESGYTRIPASLDEAARTLGSSRAAAIAWRLHMPLLWRSLAVAALMVFVDVVKELPATLLLRPFDTDTLAVIAHNLARDERLGEAALPALSIVLVGLAPVLLVMRALDGGRRRTCKARFRPHKAKTQRPTGGVATWCRPLSGETMSQYDYDSSPSAAVPVACARRASPARPGPAWAGREGRSGGTCVNVGCIPRS